MEIRETVWEILVRERVSAKGRNANTEMHLECYKTWGISSLIISSEY